MSRISRRPRLVVEGDSLSASGIWVPYALQVASASNEFYLPPSYNQAVGGETALQMMNEVGSVNAIRPDAVVILAGTNDLGLGVSASVIYSRLKYMWKNYLDSGADYVIAVDIPPRNDAGWMKNYFVLETRRLQLNDMINNLANDVDLANYRDRILVVKDYKLNPNTDTIDGLHENGVGAQKIGNAIGAAMLQLKFSLPQVKGDLNGDGTTDILYRNDSTGNIDSFQMHNGELESRHSIGDSSAAYLIAGTGDFNGDGTSDILFRNNATGDVGYWQMQNGALEAWHAISMSSTDYQVTGIGDFNGDDTSDILFRNSNTGDVGYWQIQNGTLEDWHSIGKASIDYQVAGIGDFNGDGTSDILFCNNSTGDVGYWQMQNGTLDGWHSIGKASADYLITGIGDFNGDGTSDILFRNNSTGDVGDWQMQNGTLAAWNAISGSSTAYQVAGTGDYNGDGTSDILFRDATGDLGYWQMQNGTLQSWQHIGGSSPAYGVVG
ncbi:FG-GAP-like repeat-containing protein [Methylobacterium sp. Gmos1]